MQICKKGDTVGAIVIGVLIGTVMAFTTAFAEGVASDVVVPAVKRWWNRREKKDKRSK